MQKPNDTHQDMKSLRLVHRQLSLFSVSASIEIEDVNEGQPGKVFCTASGDPRPTNITVTVNNTDVSVRVINSTSVGGNKVRGVFQASRLERSSLFTCRAENVHGGEVTAQHMPNVKGFQICILINLSSLIDEILCSLCKKL